MGLLVVLILSSCSQKEPASTLFTSVPAEESNILFRNQIVDQVDYNTLTHANFYGGGGVGIGDINNDGLMDLYFAGNQVGDKLYLNLGDLSFEDITENAGIIDDGGWSSSVLMGDVNNDGLLDVYVTREMYGNDSELMQNKLYLNLGNNNFSESSEAWGIDNSERTRGGTFFDFDNDGDLDLYLLNTPPNPGPLVDIQLEDLLIDKYTSVLYENTGERFVDITEEAGLINTGFPNSVVSADLDGDGFQDLYVTHDFTVPDCMYLNNGDGTFTNKITETTGHTSFGSMGVDASDINNDGMLDLFTSDMSAEDNYRIKANMGGMNPEAFWSVVANGGHFQYMYNTLQLNTGMNRFSEIAQLSGLATTDWSWSTFFADFDNDGNKDAYIANGLLRDIRNTDALNKLSDYINNTPRLLPAGTAELSDIYQLEPDELTELLDLFPSEKLLNYVYRNNGDLTFTKKMQDWGINVKSFSNGTAYGDLDNDGDLDLVVNNLNDYAQILENHASDNGAHFLRIKLSAKANESSVLGAKIWLKTKDGNQFFEITGTRGMYSSSEQIAHFGLGQSNKVESIEVHWPDGNKQTIMNPGVNQTLQVKYSVTESIESQANQEPKTIFTNVTKELGFDIAHIENDFDDYHLQVLLPHKMSTYGPGLAVGDVNADGEEDFYLAGAAGMTGRLILSNAGKLTETYSLAFEEDRDSEDVGALFFDADGDTDLDLYVVSGGNEYPVDSENV